MAMSEDRPDHEYAELLSQYEKWRAIYTSVGHAPRDEPVWERGRLYLRVGYPFEGWSGYIVEGNQGGCDVLRVTTEHRNEPAESKIGFFTDIEDAGKYIIWNVGESLRISCRVDPIEWIWDDLGLDPRVEQVSLDDYTSRFQLKSDPARYFVLQAGGIQPENRLLPITYTELDRELTNGLSVQRNAKDLP